MCKYQLWLLSSLLSWVAGSVVIANDYITEFEKQLSSTSEDRTYFVKLSVVQGIVVRNPFLNSILIKIKMSHYIYEDHQISFQTFFVWALLLIVHTWNSSPLRSNLHQLQWTLCTIPTTSGRPHWSPLVSACQWPSSQPLSSPQLSHNDSLWA